MPLASVWSFQRPETPGMAFRSGTTIVVLNVSVEDPHGQPVSGLTADAFEVLEDGQPQRVDHFAARPHTSAAVLVIDASSSMQGDGLAQAKRAAREFVNSSQTGTVFAFVSFDQTVTVHAPFGAQPAEMRAAIGQLEATGGTALYDAVAEAFQLTTSVAADQIAILLLSDGQDHDSWTRFADLRQLARTSPATLYAIGAYPSDDRRRFLAAGPYFKPPAADVNLNPAWVLRALSDVSGGLAFFPAPADDLSSIFATVRRDLNHQYVLGYAARPDPEGPRFREIRVHVKNWRGQSLRVRTRQGYVY